MRTIRQKLIMRSSPDFPTQSLWPNFARRDFEEDPPDEEKNATSSWKMRLTFRKKWSFWNILCALNQNHEREFSSHSSKHYVRIRVEYLIEIARLCSFHSCSIVKWNCALKYMCKQNIQAKVITEIFLAIAIFPTTDKC